MAFFGVLSNYLTIMPIANMECHYSITVFIMISQTGKVKGDIALGVTAATVSMMAIFYVSWNPSLRNYLLSLKMTIQKSRRQTFLKY